ncbi:hypothetical protein BJ742DRAFT_366195 [Cladochytrium replicatum]|nr:hypothetical protein BJ742DRAFT_366195 [Cladochytrium replicatum]
MSSAPETAGPDSPSTRFALSAFFARPDTFTLGICNNGCQMISALVKSLSVPGTHD